MVTIRLFIIEDQPAILKNQIKLLKGFSDIEIVGVAISGEEALEAIPRLPFLPDVVLCDMGLPGISGSEVTRHLKRTYSQIEVLIFTVFDEEDKVLQAVKAGAAGYMLKGTPIHKVHENLLEVYQGGSVIQPALAKKLLRYFSAPSKGSDLGGSKNAHEKADFLSEEALAKQLTTREIDCLQMIAKGLRNNEAAAVLGLSRATIRTHLEHIYQKLDVSNRVEAVTEGIRQGIIHI